MNKIEHNLNLEFCLHYKSINNKNTWYIKAWLALAQAYLHQTDYPDISHSDYIRNISSYQRIIGIAKIGLRYYLDCRNKNLKVIERLGALRLHFTV